MSTIDERMLSKLLSKDMSCRLIEPHTCSVLANTEVNSSYDKRFDKCGQRIIIETGV